MNCDYNLIKRPTANSSKCDPALRASQRPKKALRSPPKGKPEVSAPTGAPELAKDRARLWGLLSTLLACAWLAGAIAAASAAGSAAGGPKIHIVDHHAELRAADGGHAPLLRAGEPGHVGAQWQPASVFLAQNRSINFTHLLVDELSGSVYVGATNWLFQLSGTNLRPEVALRTGPAGSAADLSGGAHGATVTPSASLAASNQRDCAPADCPAHVAPVDLELLHQWALVAHQHSGLELGAREDSRKWASTSNSLHGRPGNRSSSVRPGWLASSSSSSQQQNNYNKLLALDPEARQLIVCGSLSQGACRRHQLGRLANFSELVATPVVSNDEHSSSVALVAYPQQAGSATGAGSGPLASSTAAGSGSEQRNAAPKRAGLLYVAATNSRLGPYREMVPAISARHLDGPPERLLQIVERSFTDSARVDVSFELRDYYLVNYVHAFQHNDFVYFATVQRRSPLRQLEEWGFETRLARLCSNDLSFQSYAEMSLECREQPHLSSPSGTQSQARNYNLLQDAQLAQLQVGVAANGTPKVQHFLVGAFAQSRDHTTKSAKQSAICLFPMDKVEHYFQENIQLCFNGTVKSKSMNYIAGSLSECPRGPPATVSSALRLTSGPRLTSLSKVGGPLCFSCARLSVGSLRLSVSKLAARLLVPTKLAATLGSFIRPSLAAPSGWWRRRGPGSDGRRVAARRLAAGGL